MKTGARAISGLLVLSLAGLACSLLARPDATAPAPTEAPSPLAGTDAATTVPIAATTVPTISPTDSPTAEPTTAPTATAAPLKLEVVQTQLWADYQDNIRVNVLLRNPYEFPVAPGGQAIFDLLNSAGVSVRTAAPYFLDGISGGSGFILPGETIAATACFTCDRAPVTEEWSTVEFVAVMEDASERWKYSTEVAASEASVSFNGDFPIFDVTALVTNNSGEALQRVSVRFFVFDQAGQLVGAAEASAWEVAPGATVSVDSYGIGLAPEGPVTYEVTALGVNY